MSRPGTIVERRSLRRINLDLSITRYVLYAVAALAMAGALAKVVRGEPAPVVQRVEAGRAADPAFAGFAAEFVRAYLEYDPGRRKRAKRRSPASLRVTAAISGDRGGVSGCGTSMSSRSRRRVATARW